MDASKGDAPAASNILQRTLVALFVKRNPSDTIDVRLWDGPIAAACTFAADDTTASVTCHATVPGSSCAIPGMVLVDSRVVGATATPASPFARDIEAGLFRFPWTCEARFPDGATGVIACDAPDP